MAEAALGATALLVGDTPVTAEVLDAAPSIRIVSTVTAGTDHLDLEAARERGVWVSNVPDVSTEEVASHALGMALSLMRQLPRFDREVRAGGWDALSGRRPLRPSSLTLGIVGLGRIGGRLAAISRPLFGRVLGSDPALSSAADGVALVGLAELLAESHVVSLHLPALPGNQRLIDHARMASMRPGALLVNVSRGGLIDQAALLAMLDSGHLGGAALDVLAVEPPDPEDPLLRTPACCSVRTPHTCRPFGTRRHPAAGGERRHLGAHRPAAAGGRGGAAVTSLGEAAIGLLEQHGVTTVFGIPGVHTLEYYRGLAGSGIRHVTPRHEQGGGFMADGFGRVTGTPGVCLVITGPGVTNVLTPVAQAHHDSKPLLVLSSSVAADSHGRGTIHDLPDQRALTSAVTA